MRTLQMLLFCILSIFWQPSEVLATVQTVQPTTTIASQTAPTTTLKQNRTEKKFKKFSSKNRGGVDFGDTKLLWYALIFLVAAWLLSKIAGSLIGIIATVLGIVAVVCLVLWVLRAFNIL